MHILCAESLPQAIQLLSQTTHAKYNTSAWQTKAGKMENVYFLSSVKVTAHVILNGILAMVG